MTLKKTKLILLSLQAFLENCASPLNEKIRLNRIWRVVLTQTLSCSLYVNVVMAGTDTRHLCLQQYKLYNRRITHVESLTPVSKTSFFLLQWEWKQYENITLTTVKKKKTNDRNDFSKIHTQIPAETHLKNVVQISIHNMNRNTKEYICIFVKWNRLQSGLYSVPSSKRSGDVYDNVIWTIVQELLIYSSNINFCLMTRKEKENQKRVSRSWV